MKMILVYLVITILMGIEGTGRGRTKYRGRQLSIPGQTDATEQPWPDADILKVERRQDSWHDDTGVSAVEDLDDTVVVGDVEVPVPESPNAPRQFYPGWAETASEVPQPITLPPYPTPSQQPPYQPTHRPTQSPPYQPTQYPPHPPTYRPPQPTSPPGCLAARGQFPSPNNCANYLNCWDDVVIEQQCPNGLLFNDVTGLCDFEYNVNCGSRPGATPKPPLPPGSKRCPDLNGRYRSSTNCSEFYVCLASSPIKFSCPRGLVYNDAVSVCDYTYNVDCQGAATPKPEPTPRPEPTKPTPSHPYQPTQPQQPPQTQRPQPTFPPSAYPQNPWLARETETDSWQQRSVASQPDVEMKKETIGNEASGETIEDEPTETPSNSKPWDLMHSVPAELSKVPCENGSVHRLDEACSSVIVCRNNHPELVQCPKGLAYDRPSDSCRHIHTAKC